MPTILLNSGHTDSVRIQRTPALNLLPFSWHNLAGSDINRGGIPCSGGTCSEIYLEKAFPIEMRSRKRLDVVRELGETSLMFLVHPTLSEQDMSDTCHAIEKVIGMAAE
jgi:dTDP-4-amino-4,6-dideoxygalactose transaminase